MAAINTGSHPKALWPGVRKFVMDVYNKRATEYTDIFEMHGSKMAYEEDVEVTGFGLPQIKAEGAATTYTSHTQGFTKRYTHIAYSLGYIVTREEMDDNLYKSKSFKRGRYLSESFATAKEIIAANVLNRGFNSSYQGGDGKELFATDHPAAGGAWSNELAIPAALSEASLEDMLTQIDQATNSLGHPIKLTGQRLIVPSALAFEAERILKSTLQNDTANNAVNAIRSRGLLPGGAVTNHYLTDNDAWFIKTDCSDGLLGFNRTGYEFTKDNDFDTMNAKAKAYERYCFGWTDPRGAYASAGA